jgi:Tfp pilus assembly protein PilP
VEPSGVWLTGPSQALQPAALHARTYQWYDVAAFRPVKVAVKASAQSTKPSPTTVKVAPVAAQKPVVVAAKPVPAPATVKAVAVPVAHTTSTPAPAKTVAIVPAKPVVVAAPVAHVAAVSARPAASNDAGQPAGAGEPPKSFGKAPAKGSSKPVAAAAKSSSAAPTTVAVQDNKAASNKAPKSINTAGRRDPFISPVVNMSAMGSGCSSGKRCLAIDQVALKGVVKSEGGMIAVVVNAMDKAYFLRENDPVFNGYVLKITGDSVVFKETFHDKLGKPLTREVTKTISRPVA